MHKKVSKILTSVASMALCASFLTACGATDNHVAFSLYWHENTATAQPGKTEKLTYDVTYEKGSGLNLNYTVNYTNGKYQTNLTSYTVEGQLTYKYETSLTIDVTYTCNGVTSSTFTDSVTSFVEFDGNMQPIKMKKETHSHSPANVQVSKVEDSYTYFHTVTEIDYEKGTATDVTSYPDYIAKYPDKESDYVVERSYKVKKDTEYTQIDNEQLLLAIRTVNPAEIGSMSLAIYSPYVDTVQKIDVSYSAQKSGKRGNLTINGIDVKDVDIPYYPLKMRIDAKNPGMIQSAEVGALTSTGNVYRNVVLKYSAPLSLNLGTLIYTLKTAEFM